MVFSFLLGIAVDKLKNKKILLNVGVFFVSLSWVFRIFPLSIVFSFIIENIQKYADAILLIPYETKMFEKIKKKQNFLDEFIVIREMMFHLGAAFICFLTGVLVLFCGFEFVIVIFAFVVFSVIQFLYI